MTNPGWAYNDKTASMIRKTGTVQWYETRDPKAKMVPYVPARPEPILTPAQAAWVMDAPRLIRRRRG